ncbi:recombinase family protein [Vibrio cincinnatiensis]|uniref:recombinase family protein n=1 Tax=Vibrio cincinnatiensis TaxID=675 RepID=UPI001EDD43D8|nr:recombinase family protein [Vibrio cincinnatiensis]MCG3741976.1 recombinase family protein [Vibrio cincinnatiensis]
MQINEEVLKRLSDEHNLPIAKETYQDLGKSAYKGEHLKYELGVFLEAVKSGTVVTGSILVVYSLDRLSRLEIGHAKQTYLDLTNNGVSVYAIVDNHLYRAHNAADDIIATITFERAHNESKNKSSRVRDAAKEGLKKWKATGEPQSSLGRVPFWIDQPTNKFNKNADGVRKAIELYLSGVGCLKIKQHLDEHYPYEAVRKKGRRTSRADQWDFTAINQVFTKPSLIGEKHITVDGVKHKLENYYPALIDVQTFQKLKQVKSLKAGRSPENPVNHLLKGLVKCGVCGGSMVLIDKGRGNAAINYVCSNAAKGNHQRKNYSAQMLELVTLHLCQDHYLQQANDKKNHSERIANLQKQKDDLTSELADLSKRYKEKRRSTYLDLIEDAEAKLELVENQLEELQTVNTKESFDILANDVYTDEVMNNFNHPDRKTIRKHLICVIDNVKVIRSEHESQYTKIKIVNCITLVVKFRNGQTRVLTVRPFKYLKNDDVFTPISIGSNNLESDMINIKGFHNNLITKLAKTDLLRKLYPTKGTFDWKNRGVFMGEIVAFTLPEIAQVVDKIDSLGGAGGEFKVPTDRTTKLRYWTNALPFSAE